MHACRLNINFKILSHVLHCCVASNVLHMQHTKMLHAPCNINYGQPHATFDYGQAMQHMQHVAYVALVAATLLHVADSCNKSIDTALEIFFQFVADQTLLCFYLKHSNGDHRIDSIVGGSHWQQQCRTCAYHTVHSEHFSKPIF